MDGLDPSFATVPLAGAASEESAEARIAPPSLREAPGPVNEVNASIARALQDRTELLRSVDPEPPDVTAELCEAALNEASGQVQDAQQVLRTAQGRLERETEELLARRLSGLEVRAKTLEGSGLRLALDDALAAVAESLVAGEPTRSVALLLETERHLDRLEAHWRDLQALFSQIATLRADAGDLGVDLSAVPDRVGPLRAALGGGPVSDPDLDAAAQAASQALLELHQAIPAALEPELDRHAVALGTHPPRHPRAEPARRLHAQAVRHLKEGRLSEAVRSVRELRAALEELARAPPPAPPAAAPTVPAASDGPAPAPPSAAAGPPSRARAPSAPEASGTPASPDAETIAALMKKARSLAGRVRTLPPDSEDAATAARQIHEATELLRARRYEEADEALTRLMRTLALYGPRS